MIITASSPSQADTRSLPHLPVPIVLAAGSLRADLPENGVSHTGASTFHAPLSKVRSSSIAYRWDTSTTAGIQTGNGTWGTDTYWTTDSTTLIDWPGTGSAIFAGTVSSGCVITINGTQNADSIAFLTSKYMLTGGTSLVVPKVFVASGKIDTIAAVLAGSNGLTISGSGGLLILTGKNTYSGATVVNNTHVRITSLANGGSPSSIGASSSDASNLIIDRGCLEYTYSGIDISTDRLFTITATPCTLNVSAASVTFTNTKPVVLSGSGSRLLTLMGNGTGKLSPIIGDGGDGSTSLRKTGSGTWILIGDNTFTDSTIIEAGTLQIGNGGTTGGIVNCSKIRVTTKLVTSTLYFNRSNTYTCNQILSGSGVVTQGGPGTVIFTANNTYTGKTTISNGTLQIGDGGTSGAIANASNITNNAALVFNRSNGYLYGGVISGSGTVTTSGGDTLTFTGNNTYSGTTTINNGILQIGSGDTSGTISNSSNITNNATLVFNRSDSCTYRGTISGSGTVTKSGSEMLTLTGNNTYSGTTTIKSGTLRIGDGSITGEIASTSAIVNNGALIFNRSDATTYSGTISGTGSVIKSGDGTLSLSGINSYSGATTISGGKLLVNGSLASESAVSVDSGTTLGGKGTCSGLITVHGGTIAPGTSEPGKLSTGTLTLDEASVLNFDLGSVSDTIAVTGALTLDGTINFSDAAGFAAGTYRLFTFTSSLTDNSLDIGSWPSGMDCSIVFGDGYVDVKVDSTKGLIKGEPRDSLVLVGQNVSFTVTAKGTGTLSYKWLRYPDDSVGNGATLTLASVTPADNDARFHCIVRDTSETDTSRWVRCLVIDTPHIIVQPANTKVAVGGNTGLFLKVYDTTQTTYAWMKKGSTSVLSTTDSLTINVVAFSDSGDYFCIVTNSGGTVSSDTVQLSVVYRKPVAAFSLSPHSGHVPLSVSFTDASTDTITVRLWRFGDGDISTETNPTHIYASNGTYNVTLIVIGPGGTDSLVKRDSVTASEAPVNSVDIKDLNYDTLAASIKISWCVDEAILEENAQVGISYSLDSFPTDPTGVSVVSLLSQCTDTSIVLHDYIPFDSLCYVALWFRINEGTWIEPTTDSRDTVRIGHPFRQIVSLFNPLIADDTISVFNGAVRLWKDHTYTDKTPTIDTVEIVTLDNAPEGMSVVGTSLRFRKADPVLPFYIGIHVDSIPHRSSLDDIRIYSDSADVFHVNYSTMVDSVHRFVYVKTSDIRHAFFAMIDTSIPRLKIFSDTGSFAISSEPLKDSLRIIDNIANVRWKYYFGKGEEVPQLRAQGELSSTTSYLSLTVPDTIQAISSESGLRASLVIDDGHHTTTLDLSRCVIRDESDKVTTTKNEWNPIYPTAELNRKDAGVLIEQLVEQLNLNDYDKRYLRLYRWFDFEDNEQDNDKWVEYNESSELVQSLFTLEPGRLFWLKTRGNVPLHLDSGRTLSLKDTFTLELPSKQWMDFGMPYHFSVRLEEILSASGSDADSIQIYRWTKDESTMRYALVPLYVPGMPDMEDRSKVIEYTTSGGYSLYNRHSKTVVLRIPPLPSVMAKKLGKRRENDGQSWSAKFIAQADDATVFPAVYFGYSTDAAKNGYPLPPSFSPIRLSVYDRETAKRYGHCIRIDAESGLTGELLVNNEADSVHTIRFHLEKAGNFPDNYRAYCFDATANQFTSEGTITVSPKSKASRLIVIGDAAYQQNFMKTVISSQFSLHTLYPNPARANVNIRYSVPLGTQEYVRIAIYNVLGKRVWEKSMNTLLAGGEHIITWKGKDVHGNPAGSGLYIVQLTVIDSDNRIVKRFEQRMTYMQ